MAEVTGELLCLPTGSQAIGAGGRVEFPAKTVPKERARILRIPSKPYSVHSVHSAIGSTMNIPQGHPTRKNRKNASNAVFCFLISFYGL